MNKSFKKLKKIHFVGIGGIGMSGIAELLYNHGYEITGSDIYLSERVKHLLGLNIKIDIGHNKKNICKQNLLVYSSAVDKNNPEIIKAIKLKIPIMKRAEILGQLIKIKNDSIAVAGTHGKTTTSSMIGNILYEAKLNPTIITGGIIKKFNSNNVSGNGDIIVVEADEYDKSFLSLCPTYSIINNIDLEHIDIYKNLKNLKQSFIDYANSTPFYGMIFICNDSKNIRDIKNKIKKSYTTFGIDYESDIMASNIRYKKNKSFFDITINKDYYSFELTIPGKHNIYNALSAISTCLQIGIDIKYIIKGLKEFTGVKRRFEIKYTNKNRGIKIIDDYAHHPSEILETLNGIKSGWSNKRIITVFQPHLFSRTKTFYKEFAQSLYKSNIVFITDIYGSREKFTEKISSELIIDELKNIGHKNTFKTSIDNIHIDLKTMIKNNDFIVTMGAGDIYKTIKKIKDIV